MCSISRLLLLANLIGSFASSVSGIYEMRSMQIFTAQDLRDSIEQLSLPGQGLSLVAEDGNHLYLGGRNAVYQVLSANLSQAARVAAWPAAAARVARTDGGGGALVRSVYFPGNSSDLAFVCAIVGVENRVCHQFDRRERGDSVWSLASKPLVSRQISALLLPPLFPSAATLQRPPLSLKRAGGGSRVFFAALPPIRDSTDLVELTGPAFADIGFTTADLYSRRNRAFWMVRGARAQVMHEDGDRLYTVYTEPAAETSNYVENINGDRPGLVKVPIFTRLSRVCLNDPGQTIGNQTKPRVLTSFFKMRLICRHDGADFDVLELATEVFDGQFIGLFAIQNSPPDGFRAICRFRLAEAERLLSGDGGGGRGVGDFIEMSRPSWQSPWQAGRLTRADFKRRSDVSRPFDCVWTPADVERTRYSDLLVSRMAALLAQPLVSAALTVLPPRAATGRRPTALTALPAGLVEGVKLDQLIVGWDTGEVTRLVVNAIAALSPAVETLQALPPGQAVDSVIVRHRRLLVIGSDGASALPLTRCGGGGGGGGCADCALLGDPLCAWVRSADGSDGSCVDLTTLRGRSAAEVADAAAATAACGTAAPAARNSSVASLRGLPLSPPAAHPDPRHLASVGDRSSGRSDEAAPDGVASAGIGTGAFLGALVGASLLAFLFGVALGVGCLADSAVSSCRGKRPPPPPTPSSSSHQQPLSSVSTSSSTTSSSTGRRGARKRGGESGLMSSAGRFLLRGLIAKAPMPTEENAKLAEEPHQARGPKASEMPGILSPQSRASSDQRLRCRDNEYVQVADLVPIAAVAEVSGPAAPRSLGSSWESCVGETAVISMGETAVEPPLRQPQPQRHQVTVNAGIIGQLSLTVGFNPQNT